VRHIGVRLMAAPGRVFDRLIRLWVTGKAIRRFWMAFAALWLLWGLFTLTEWIVIEVLR
jgi:hypothetical protein